MKIKEKINKFLDTPLKPWEKVLYRGIDILFNIVAWLGVLFIICVNLWENSDIPKYYYTYKVDSLWEHERSESSAWKIIRLRQQYHLDETDTTVPSNEILLAAVYPFKGCRSLQDQKDVEICLVIAKEIL